VTAASGWRSAISCTAALFHSTHPDWLGSVSDSVENGQAPRSIEMIRQWYFSASGRSAAPNCSLCESPTMTTFFVGATTGCVHTLDAANALMGAQLKPRS